jgi:predicted nucleotidyltransferase
MTMLERTRQALHAESPKLRMLGIGRAGVFGSVVRGEDGPDSDVDILIELLSDHRLTLLSMVELEDELSGKLNKKVDLVVGSSMKPLIKERAYLEVVYVFP